MKTQALCAFALVFALIVSFGSGARADSATDGGITTAEVTRTSQYGLIVQEFQSVSIAGVKYLDSDKYGYKAGSLVYAELEFNALVVPHGCNTSYFRGEILAQVRGDDVYETVNPTTKVALGTLDLLGGFSSCVGLPPRPVHLRLVLVNGITRLFSQERVFTFQFDAPANRVTQNLEQWLVRVTVNQSTGKIDVDQHIARKNDEPVIPAAYTQTIQCDTSDRMHNVGEYPADDRLDITVTKVAGDAADAKNYSVAVTGTSQSFFGAGSAPRKFALVADPTPPAYADKGQLYFLDASANPQFSTEIDTRDLGWLVNGRTVALTFKWGDKSRWAVCAVTSVTPAL